VDREKSAEAVGAGITARQRAAPVVEARDGIPARPEQMPRKRALKPEVADGIREVRLGAHRAAGDDVTKARNNRNRRIRNRSYGGVGGRGPRGPLLPDFARLPVARACLSSHTSLATATVAPLRYRGRYGWIT